ncbi:MAG: hypothetical protein GY722_01930 [bacterium]|nr:hypothetical protein [bacterium]
MTGCVGAGHATNDAKPSRVTEGRNLEATSVAQPEFSQRYLVGNRPAIDGNLASRFAPERSHQVGNRQ